MRRGESEGAPSDGASQTGVGRFERLAQPAKSRVSGLKERSMRRLAPYESFPSAELLLQVYRRDREMAGAVMGSAVAFRVFQFFVPFLLFVIGAASFLSDFVTAQEVDHATGVSGGLAAQIGAAFAHHSQDQWVVTLVGLWGMAIAGRSLTRVLFADSAAAWRMPMTSRAPLKVVGSIAGFVFCIGLVVVLINRVRIQFGYGAAGASFGPALAIYAVAWLAISSLLPRPTNDPGALLPGSALMGFTITAMQSISQFYLPSHLARAGELYGTIGATVVTLGWFFILGRAVTLAMVLNAVVYERYGSISTWAFSLPLLRVLARRSAWLRQFFDLDARPPAGS
jgi:uncharacterized BrkB/YihY/UPF0761 family membrane protein